MVGAVAPRVRPVTGPSAAGRYLAARAPVDLGPRKARVAPLTRLSYVPTAALLVRRDAVGRGFDPALRYGEDVDLIWRMVDAGWRVAVRPGRGGPPRRAGPLARGAGPPVPVRELGRAAGPPASGPGAAADPAGVAGRRRRRAAGPAGPSSRSPPTRPAPASWPVRPRLGCPGPGCARPDGGGRAADLARRQPVGGPVRTAGGGRGHRLARRPLCSRPGIGRRVCAGRTAGRAARGRVAPRQAAPRPLPVRPRIPGRRGRPRCRRLPGRRGRAAGRPAAAPARLASAAQAIRPTGPARPAGPGRRGWPPAEK